MVTMFVKWISLAASLVMAAMSWTPRSGGVVLLVGFIVFAGLVVTLVQAFTRRQYGWAFILVPLAIVCNPVLPVSLTAPVLLGLNLACAATFGACLIFLHSAPRMTIDSITDSAPSESL